MTIPCSVQPGFSYTAYPCGIDSSDQLPITVDNQTPVRAEVVNRHRESIIAVESELGINPSGTFTTVRARLDALEALLSSIIITGTGLSTVKKDNVTVATNVKSLNFIGAAVTVTAAPGDQADVTITGTGSDSVAQKQETRAVLVNGQTVFSLTDLPLDSTAVLMFINGIKQQYGPDYTVTGSAVNYTGSVSLITTDIIEFWYIVEGFVTQVQETIPVTILGQTAFSLTQSPSNDTAVMMFVNGVKQQYGSDYTVVVTAVNYIGSITLDVTDIVEFWYIHTGGGGGGGGGSQTLAQTLAAGNFTGGIDIVVSSGDAITSLAGAVNIGGGVNIDSELTVPLTPGASQGLFWVQDNSSVMLPMFSDSTSDYELDKHLKSTVTTLNATPTTIETIPTTGADVLLVETRVVAKDQASDNSATYIRRARIRMSGGVPSVFNLQTEYTSEDDFAWDATITTSGSNVLVSVTGALATTIDWKSSTYIEVM